MPPGETSLRRSGSLPPSTETRAGANSPGGDHQRQEEFAEYALMTVNTRIAAIKMSIGRFENLCRNIETEEKKIPIEYEKLRKDIIMIGSHAVNQGVSEVCGDSLDYLGLELETICNRIDSHLIEIHGVSSFSNRLPIPRIRPIPTFHEDEDPPTSPINRSTTPPNSIPLHQELEEAAQAKTNPPTPNPRPSLRNQTPAVPLPASRFDPPLQQRPITPSGSGDEEMVQIMKRWFHNKEMVLMMKR